MADVKSNASRFIAAENLEGLSFPWNTRRSSQFGRTLDLGRSPTTILGQFKLTFDPRCKKSRSILTPQMKSTNPWFWLNSFHIVFIASHHMSHQLLCGEDEAMVVLNQQEATRLPFRNSIGTLTPAPLCSQLRNICIHNNIDSKMIVYTQS